MKQSLVELARTNKFDELESNWIELMISDITAVDTFLLVSELLRARSQGAKAANLLTQLSDELYAQKKWEHLKGVLYYCSEKFSKMRSIREHSLECIRTLNKSNTLLDAYLEKSGLSKDRDLYSAWSEFNTYFYLSPGSFVLHQTQFGAGVVTAADPFGDKVEIDFIKKKAHTMGLSFAAKVLSALPDTHYYSQMVKNEMFVREMFERNPAALIKMVVKSFGQEIPIAKLKDEISSSNRVNSLIDLKVDSKAWTNWWAKAKKAVDKDKFLTVTVGIKGTITARENELSSKDEALINIQKLENIFDKITVVRNFLKDNEVEEAQPLLEKLSEYYVGLKDNTERIELLAILLMGRYKVEDNQKLLDEVLLNLGSPLGKEGEILKVIEQPFYKVLDSLKTNDAKRAMLSYIHTTYAKDWLKIYQIIAHIDDSYLWNQTISALKEEGSENVKTAIDSVFSYPDKFPGAFFRMSKEILADRLAGDGLPSGIDVLRKLIFVLEISSVNPQTKLMQANIPKLFAESKCDQVFKNFLENAPKKDFELIYNSLISREENNEAKLRAIVQRIAFKRFPELIIRKELPYWLDVNKIFITAVSRDRIEKELNDIINIKLPENSKAIGEAQALGDLSENAEFDAAKEERERLNRRAKELRTIVEGHFLIEGIDRQEGRVELGTKVTIRDLQTQARKTYKILSEHEAFSDETALNYKAPFAQAMLGKNVGDKFESKTGEESHAFLIEATEMISF